MRSILILALISLVINSCGENKKETKLTSAKQNIELNSFILPVINDCGYQSTLSDSEGWELVFEDDFDNGYNSNWIAWRGGAYNEELQHYQKENVFVENGFLYLYGKRERIEGRTRPDDETIKRFDFTSARLESKQLFGPEDIEGKSTIKFSARLKLVEGEGIWPAWWSYAHPWPVMGETDIVEARGHQPYRFNSCFHYGAKPSRPETDASINDFHYDHAEKLTTCFHVYDLEWSETYLKILFDGEVVKTYDVESYPFVKGFWLKKHMLCLNLAIGGNFFKTYNESLIPDESFYVVDWVKIYRR